MLFFTKERSETLRPAAGQGVLDLHRSAKALDELCCVRALEAVGEVRRVAVP